MPEFDDPAAIEADIDREIDTARTALAAAGRLLRRLEQSADVAAARASAAGGALQLVKIRSIPPIGPNGKPVLRGRGRPKGARNRPVLYATEAQIAALRDQLAR